MRSVNRVGEIYVGERETKGNQSFRKIFALWLLLALIEIHFKTTVSTWRDTQMDHDVYLLKPCFSKRDCSAV